MSTVKTGAELLTVSAKDTGTYHRVTRPGIGKDFKLDQRSGTDNGRMIRNRRIEVDSYLQNQLTEQHSAETKRSQNSSASEFLFFGV